MKDLTNFTKLPQTQQDQIFESAVEDAKRIVADFATDPERKLTKQDWALLKSAKTLIEISE